MSYLQIDSATLQDFSKVTISLWFRVPQSSIDAALAASTGDERPFDGIIPLVVMGEKGTGRVPYQISQQTVVEFNLTVVDVEGAGNTQTSEDLGGGMTQITSEYNPNAQFVNVPADGGTITVTTTTAAGDAPPTNPTFIGVDCHQGQAYLRLNFETAEMQTVTNYWLDLRSITPGSQTVRSGYIYGGPVPSAPGPDDAYPSGTVVNIFAADGQLIETVSDTSHWTEWPVPPQGPITPSVHHYADVSSLGLQYQTGAISSDEGFMTIAPNVWHHALISLDLETVATHGLLPSDNAPGNDISEQVDGYSRLFTALDDVNYTGWDLLDNWVGGSDPNATLTNDAYNVAQTAATVDRNQNSAGEYVDTVMPLPQYVLSNPSIPCSRQAMGLPATAEFVDSVYHIEMAEFQMFTGVAIDTGYEEYRRLFVDDHGYPVDPSIAAHALGQPDILLHKSANWIKGKNTGSLGQDMSPAGDFVPTGRIVAYKPDPSLRGDQGEPQIVRLSKKPVDAL